MQSVDFFWTSMLRQLLEQTRKSTKFPTATFLQTPEYRCFVTSRFHVDLSVQNNLAHRSQSSIPNSVLQFLSPHLNKIGI